MASSDEEDESFDAVILQIFEEQADKFTFPLTTQKQTRDFVRLLNRKGFDYEMIADAVGEKLTYFQSWRLGSDSSSIGARVLKRINRPLQDAMLSDDDDKVVDKVKQLLFNGMSIDIDDADGALDAIDDKRRKKILERDTGTAKGKTSSKEKKDASVSSSSEKHTAAENKEVKNVASVEDLHVTKDKSEESPTAKNNDNKKVTDKVETVPKTSETNSKTDKKLSERSKSDDVVPEKGKTEEIKSLETPRKDQTKCESQPATSKKVTTETLNGVPVTKSDANLNEAHSVQSVNRNAEKSINSVDTESKHGIKNTTASLGSPTDTLKSESQDKLAKVTSKSEPPVSPTSPISISKLPESLPIKPTQIPIVPSESLPTSNNQASGPGISSIGHVGSTTDDVGVHQLKVSFGAKPHPPIASPISGCTGEKVTDPASSASVKGSIEAAGPSSPKSVSSPVLPKSAGEIVSDKPIPKLEVVSSPKKEQTISLPVIRSQPISPSVAVDSVNRQSDKIEKPASSNVKEAKPVISWTDSVDSSTASESESSSSSSGISSSTKKSTPSAKSDSKCTARVLPALPKQPPPDSKTHSTVWISDENYDSDLDWDEMNKLSSPTPQAKLVDSIRLFKKSVSEVDGPGFIYAMSDTAGSMPIATLEGTHRVKIGVSRFPLKRFEQAKMFNPDIKLLISVPVRKRRGAIIELSAELSSMTFRDIRGWYRGSIVKILQLLDDLEKS